MSDFITIKPMTVTRVEHAGVSSIEPPLDDAWSAEKKLAWKLGCFIEDTGCTGLQLHFFPTNWCITAPGTSMGGGIGSPRHDLNGIWNAINWIKFGIYIGRDEAA